MTLPRRPNESPTAVVDLYMARGRLRAEVSMQGYELISELFNNQPGEFIGAEMRMASVGDQLTMIRRELVVRLRDVRLVRPIDQAAGPLWPATHLERILARVVLDMDDWQVTGDIYLVDRIPWLDYAATAHNRFIAVTNASVRFVNVAEPLECSFLLVNGTRISALYEVVERMRSHRAALVTLAAGALTFALVFTMLQLTLSEAAGVQPVVVVVATPEPTTPPVVPVAMATDSLAPSLAAGDVAVGVPSTGSEPLLESVQRGDRLDVLASLPSPDDTRPVTAVVVSGATVLSAATASDPLLLEVSSSDALVLAHLVLGGTHLSFVVWSTAGSPPQQQPLDEQAARLLLGLPTVIPTSTTQPEPTSTPAPVPSPVPTAIVETYTVQTGESLDSVAALLGVDSAVLWWTNRGQIDQGSPLVAGTRLQVPLVPGFLYQVQPGDTWDSMSATFTIPAATLRQRNAQPEDAPLPAGTLVFIPRPT